LSNLMKEKRSEQGRGTTDTRDIYLMERQEQIRKAQTITDQGLD